MRIAGGKSLLVQTYERALASSDCAPIIVTNRDYYFLSRDELAGQSLKPHYLLEPAGRNTAPAIVLAALAARQHGDPCLLVMPADHLVGKTESFRAAANNAHALAEEGLLVLFGIRPTKPETGFGYIEMGDALNDHARKVLRFVEKPDAATAEGYIAQGNYAWNSGMFCFKASTILEAFAKHAPALLVAAEDVWRESETEGDKTELKAAFAQLENISVDYAVMEKAENIAVIPGDLDWSDIGSWSAVADAMESDSHNNTSSGQNVFIDTRNTHIQSEDRLVAAVGLNNLLIIDTPDAVLVADKSKSQDVRKVVGHLKNVHHESYKLHRTVARPWGTYTVLEEGPGFKIKRIVVKPGASLSLQMHHHRSEHWVVVSGSASVTVGSVDSLIAPNQSTYIPIGEKHRLHNPGVIDLVIIEVQCGSYLGEDDIVRFTDNYGRT
jgi:mannose-1-phosphate guanylyltransferase/mannose-6-phosphate isomerase